MLNSPVSRIPLSICQKRIQSILSGTWTLGISWLVRTATCQCTRSHYIFTKTSPTSAKRERNSWLPNQLGLLGDLQTICEKLLTFVLVLVCLQTETNDFGDNSVRHVSARDWAGVHETGKVQTGASFLPLNRENEGPHQGSKRIIFEQSVMPYCKANSQFKTSLDLLEPKIFDWLDSEPFGLLESQDSRVTFV